MSYNDKVGIVLGLMMGLGVAVPIVVAALLHDDSRSDAATQKKSNNQ